MEFRDLRAEEIDVRVATINEKGCSLLLYKDARCDMTILDEAVGAENWQRKHTRDNANCIVSIWCKEKQQWVEKEDTGTESNTEKEKGQASDSFKRACVNWGIGRELYTAPFIWVGSDKVSIGKNPRNGNPTTYDKFIVADIEIIDKRITRLSIANAKTGEIVYRWQKAASNGSRNNVQSNQQSAEPSAPALTEESKQALNTAIKSYQELTGEHINTVMSKLKKAIGKSHKEYTEADAKKALEVLSKMQADYMNELGV